MSDARVSRADRRQAGLEVVSLEALVPEDHRVRAVWAFVEGLDLSSLYDRIKARDDRPGRPATDPAVLLALWLYATVEGVGSARALARLCQHHTIYRWICGGVGVTHTCLCEFRVEHTAFLDRLMAQSLAAMIAEGLLRLDEVATDGTKVRASASRSSMRRRPSLEAIERRVAERIARLRADLDGDPASGERRHSGRRLAVAQARAERVAAALAALGRCEAARARRAGERRAGERPGATARTAAEAEVATDAAAEAKAARSAPRASTTDADARVMKMADNAIRPCYNIQVATAGGFVVGIVPTTQGNDKDMAGPMVAEVERLSGRTPCRLLADSGAMSHADIVGLARTHPALAVYAPPYAAAEASTPASKARRARNLAREPACLRAWRARMRTPEGVAIYARRCRTEHVHATLKNRGFARLLVRGIAKVRAVCLLHAVAHNMMHAITCRARQGAIA